MRQERYAEPGQGDEDHAAIDHLHMAAAPIGQAEAGNSKKMLKSRHRVRQHCNANSNGLEDKKWKFEIRRLAAGRT
jgi:hypothetical protein